MPCALSVILHVKAYESSSTRLHLHEQLASCIKTGVQLRPPPCTNAGTIQLALPCCSLPHSAVMKFARLPGVQEAAPAACRPTALER